MKAKRSVINGGRLLRSLLLPLMLLVTLARETDATGTSSPMNDYSLDCEVDSDCRVKFGETSTCMVRQPEQPNLCTNPLSNGGCLYNKIANWPRKRVCNSQDPPGALAQGLCIEPALDYTEIRIQSQNWESAIVVTYLMQILLSEMLGVPVSIETSFHDDRTSFYDQEMRLQFGFSDDLEAMRRGHQVKDCVLSTLTLDGYTPCSHVISEAWGSHRWALELVSEGVIEPTQSMGEIGREGWYIPLHTALAEPSLFHYSGLMGEENRQKLASMFKRPITWRQYCDEVSPTQCSTPDDTASRYPSDIAFERDKYFAPGLFQGHFIATEKNNCILDANCTGHFVPFSCVWSSYAEPQIHHFNIALEGGGPEQPTQSYSYESMHEIWRAANATKSHVIMIYMKPEALYQEFANTDYSFQRITFPETTEECVKARRPRHLQCSQFASFEERMGDKAGTCDEPEEALQRVVVEALKEITIGDDIPAAVKSPAYYAVKEFKIDNIQIGDIFTRWVEQYDRDKHIGLREATCEWAVDNLEFLQGYVPDSYPRVVEESDDRRSALSISATTIAAVAIVCSLATSVVTYLNRKRTSITLAKIEFLWILLAGLLLVSTGSLVGSLPPTDATCVATTWLINLGYSLELVPLLVKSAALNRVMSAGRRMRRSAMKTSILYAAVGIITILVIGLLAIWTIIDPAQSQSIYLLTSSKTETGDTVVAQEYVCKSASDGWWIASLAFQLFLLFASAVLAFQNRNFREDLADTRTLGVLVYSHVIFLVLRGVTYILDISAGQNDATLYQSLLVSTDVFATIAIYFLPKFFKKNDFRRRRSFISGSLQLFNSDDNVLTFRGNNVSNDTPLEIPSNHQIQNTNGRHSSGTSHKSPERAGSISPQSDVEFENDDEIETDSSLLNHENPPMVTLVTIHDQTSAASNNEDHVFAGA
jgi:hypothetical protein